MSPKCRSPAGITGAGRIFDDSIGLMSLLVVSMALERGLALRRSKVLPVPLLRQLAALAVRPEGFDPRLAYRLCQFSYPSAASNVIRSVLLVVEPAAAGGRAGSRGPLRSGKPRGCVAYVRWLSLAARATPASRAVGHGLGA